MKAFLALLLLLAGIPLAYGQTPNVSTALFYNNFGSLNVSWQGNSPSIVTITPGSGSITDFSVIRGLSTEVTSLLKTGQSRLAVS